MQPCNFWCYVIHLQYRNFILQCNTYRSHCSVIPTRWWLEPWNLKDQNNLSIKIYNPDYYFFFLPQVQKNKDLIVVIIYHRTIFFSLSPRTQFRYYKGDLIDYMSRVCANGLEDQGSIPGQVIPKTQKMVLDVVLLNTQHYKVRIKGKVEQCREWSSALLYTLV